MTDTTRFICLIGTAVKYHRSACTCLMSQLISLMFVILACRAITWRMPIKTNWRIAMKLYIYYIKGVARRNVWGRLSTCECIRARSLIFCGVSFHFVLFIAIGLTIHLYLAIRCHGLHRRTHTLTRAEIQTEETDREAEMSRSAAAAAATATVAYRR